MKDLGLKLKESREKKGKSIQEVAVATKINAKTIQSIEEADMDNLPAKPFLRGFVQTYARYLELNVDEIMNKFLEDLGTTKPKTQKIEDTQSISAAEHEEEQRKIELYKKIGFLTAGLIGVLLIWGIFKVISKYEAETKVAIEQREEVLTKKEPSQEVSNSASPADNSANTSQAQAPGVASNTPTQTSNPANATAPLVSTAPQAPTPAPAAAVTPAAAVPIPAPVQVAQVKPAPESPQQQVTAPKKNTEQQAVTPQPPKPIEATQQQTNNPNRTRPQEIILEALDNVEVRYQRDNEGEKTIRLKPERVFIIRAKEKVSLSISDAGAVSVIHNGKDKGVPGSLGQNLKVSYP